MKVERWEEESDEEWAERLVYETAIANNTETTLYMVHRDPYEEDGFIINYVGETSMTWKEHPEGPFKAVQILGWKNKAELLPIYEKQYGNMVEHALEREDKLEAVKNYIVILRDAPENTMMTTSTIANILDKILEGSEITTKGEDDE